MPNIFTLTAPSIGYKKSVSVNIVDEKKIAEITIVNYGNDPDINAAKYILEGTFKYLYLKIKINIVNSDKGLTQKDVLGINAVYLFGNNNRGENYESMYNTVKKIYPNSGFEEEIAGLNSSNFESATGWSYHRIAAYQDKLLRHPPKSQSIAVNTYSKTQANLAVFSTTGIKNARWLTGNHPIPQMKNSQLYALIILHVMGHNAGLQHPKTPVKWVSPIANGDRLWELIKGSFTYESIAQPDRKDKSIKPDLSYKLWERFVRSYFDSNRWNGNVRNSSLFLDFIKWQKNFDPYLNIKDDE